MNWLIPAHPSIKLFSVGTKAVVPSPLRHDSLPEILNSPPSKSSGISDAEMSNLIIGKPPRKEYTPPDDALTGWSCRKRFLISLRLEVFIIDIIL